MKSIEEMSLNEVLNEQRIIFVSNTIDQSLSNNIIAKLLYFDALDSSKDISLYINTLGGDVDATRAIIDVMNFIKADVATVNISCAYSAGSLLLASGAKGKRYTLPSAKAMIHSPSIVTSRTNWSCDELNETTKSINKTKEEYIESMIELTNLTRDQMNGFMKRDTYLNSLECIELGIVDKLLKG